jgi:perosamine synthetase
MSFTDTAKEPGMQRKGSNFRHLPPTAVEVEWGDLQQGFNALLHPEIHVENFRKAILAETSSPFCELVSSGRSALVLILKALKTLSNRTKVILPAYSCSTVVQSVLEAGLTPAFCDMSVINLDLDRENLVRLIDEEVLAVVPTHLYGLAQDISDIIELGMEHGFYVIEDAAQSFGAMVSGKWVGTSGDAGFSSLGRGKCIPSGHGGVILAGERCAPAITEAAQQNVKEKAARDPGSLAGFLGYAIATKPFIWWFIDRSPLNPADQGMDVDTLPAINMQQISSVQAGIANSIFDRLEKINSIRRDNALRLINLLSNFDFIQFPEISPQAEPVFLRLPFIVDRKDIGTQLFSSLRSQGIGISKSYFRTLPDMYVNLVDSNPRDYPGANHISRCLYTLPTHAYLQENDFEIILNTFCNVSKY